MASLQGINVEIISGGVPLQCYDDHDQATNRESGEARKYIAAVTDAKFAVAFHLTKEFHFRNCDGIKIAYVLDGDSIGNSFVKQTTFMGENRNYKGACGAHKVFCATSRTWRRADWSFGKLNIQEATDVSISPEQLKHLGSITINIQRVMRQKFPVPIKEFKTFHKRIESVPEKLLKGQAISNSVSLVTGAATSTPKPIKWEYVPISGPLGAAMEFTFLYRSKHALQILGCIPRTPSPDLSLEPLSPNRATQSTAPKLDPTLDPSERDRKVSALKAQLAFLERSGNANIKSESTPSASVTSDAPARLTSFKREYDGVELVGERKRCRLSGRIETVDLTDG